MQIKAVQGYHLSPVRMAMNRRKKIPSAGMNTENRGPLYIVNGNVNYRVAMVNSTEVSANIKSTI